MMIYMRPVLVFFLIAFAQSVRGQTRGTVTPNTLLDLPSTFDGAKTGTKITLDANWRWTHKIGEYTNCYTDKWDSSVCPDPVSCSKNCALEGISQEQWLGTYGVSTSGDAVTLRYVTNGPYGKNVGSRVYLMDADGANYKRFDLLGKQFTMTADMSKLPCALNGAVYFVEIPMDGGRNSLNTAGASYGTGYGDAQCPKDIKYINGYTNINGTGACANELDIWEANAAANAFTPHPCKVTGTYGCASAATCGDGDKRYSGVCDKDGADYNAYRAGDKTLYGPGSSFKIDSTKPFDIITQFIESGGELVKIQRYYKQGGGALVDGGAITDASIAEQKKKFGEENHFAKLGGLKEMGKSLKRGHVLVMSIWDDNGPTQMRWLDSVYPVGSSTAGSLRGPCAVDDSRDVEQLRSKHSSASVVYSNIRVEAISSPSPAPTPTPAPTAKKYWKCSSCKLIE